MTDGPTRDAEIEQLTRQSSYERLARLELSEEKRALVAEVERLRAENERLREAADVGREFADGLTNRGNQFLAERDAARAECRDLYPAIESLRDELRRAKAENDKLRAEIANAIADKIAERYDMEWDKYTRSGGATGVGTTGLNMAESIARSFADPEGEK
jgi:chromosome segregation ATPase